MIWMDDCARSHTSKLITKFCREVGRLNTATRRVRSRELNDLMDTEWA